jgi:hypothetical protein
MNQPSNDNYKIYTHAAKYPVHLTMQHNVLYVSSFLFAQHIIRLVCMYM